MKNLIKLFSIIVLSLILSSCATIFSGSHDDVTFSSTPPGAKVIIDGKEFGKTPITLIMETDESYNVDFILDDYDNYHTTIESNFNYVSLLNILWFYPPTIGICVGIDLITGSAFRLNKTKIHIMFDGVSNQSDTTNTN